LHPDTPLEKSDVRFKVVESRRILQPVIVIEYTFYRTTFSLFINAFTGAW
jgi:hypothetical protein